MNLQHLGDNKCRLALLPFYAPVPSAGSGTFAFSFANFTKKRGVSATYSIAVRQNLNGINAKTHATWREPRNLVFRIFKILPISIESQEQSSNLCQKRDYLIKTSFFTNIIKFLQGGTQKKRVFSTLFQT